MTTRKELVEALRLRYRRGRSIQTRSPSVCCQRGVVMVISYSPCTLLPQSGRSTRSTMSRPFGSCAGTIELHSMASSNTH